MKVVEELRRELEKVFEKLGFAKEDVSVTFSDRPELCDFQCNSAFTLSKKERKAPIEIAKIIASEITSDKLTIEAVMPGFINITLSNKYLSEILQGLYSDDRCGIENKKSKKVIIDYGGPNVAKPLHVGHLRSAVIGETLKHLARFMSDEVVGDVHLGDWGLQMGLTISNILEKYDCEYYYSGKGKKPDISIDDLNKLYPEAAGRAKIDEDFKKRAQNITVKLQAKEQPYYDIWQYIRKISIDAIKENYERLNVNFDLWNGESDAQPFIEKTFEILHNKKLIEKSEGAEIVNVAKETDNAPMPPVIVRSSAGAGLYATTDIATIISRVEKFNPDEIWYLTDNRQCMHFEQVFRICRLAGIVRDDVKLEHFPFGTINGTDGKPFKTRDGGIMALADLIDLIVDACEDKLKESEKATDLSERERKELATKIGISALKFGDMINYREKDYIFDIPKFCSFEGKTGPYLLYSLVRINSILEKAGKFKPSYSINTSIEKQIIINLLKFACDVKSSYEDRAPNIMVQSAYSLASAFNTLYNQTKILSEDNAEKKNTLLTLLSVVKKALTIFAEILGVEIPEKM